MTRFARVSGTSGPGVVDDFHEWESQQEGDDFAVAMGWQCRMVEPVPEWVALGTEYDGSDFVSPQQQQPTLAAAEQLKESAIATLTSWHRQKTDAVLSKSPDRDDSWGPLLEEMRVVRAKDAGDVTLDDYPAIKGRYEGYMGGMPDAQQLKDFADGIATDLENLQKLSAQLAKVRDMQTAEIEAAHQQVLAPETEQQGRDWFAAFDEDFLDGALVNWQAQGTA